jgi:ribosomal RNA-processing protein 1
MEKHYHLIRWSEGMLSYGLLKTLGHSYGKDDRGCGIEEQTREKAFEQLVEALKKQPEQVHDPGLLKDIWEGLFFCTKGAHGVVFWHADKPKYQNQTAQRMARLGAGLPQPLAFEWLRAALSCLTRHWTGIDKHRHNKFLYLIRTHIHETLLLLLPSDKRPLLPELCALLKDFVVPGENTADGVALQLIGIWLEEVETTLKEVNEEEMGEVVELLLFVSGTTTL